jgi:hypothetical protein
MCLIYVILSDLTENFNVPVRDRRPTSKYAPTKKHLMKKDEEAETS